MRMRISSVEVGSTISHRRQYANDAFPTPIKSTNPPPIQTPRLGRILHKLIDNEPKHLRNRNFENRRANSDQHADSPAPPNRGNIRQEFEGRALARIIVHGRGNRLRGSFQEGIASSRSAGGVCAGRARFLLLRCGSTFLQGVSVSALNYRAASRMRPLRFCLSVPFLSVSLTRFLFS